MTDIASLWDLTSDLSREQREALAPPTKAAPPTTGASLPFHLWVAQHRKERHFAVLEKQTPPFSLKARLQQQLGTSLSSIGSHASQVPALCPAEPRRATSLQQVLLTSSLCPCANRRDTEETGNMIQRKGPQQCTDQNIPNLVSRQGNQGPERDGSLL